ncbi:DUF1349 domain-containing protein [Metabacillus indicus]|uniref:DUF1349 domain-containing protein n=1 Tax=Metabacillus indicus TaxID=246786 RepID=UPI002A0A0CC2|nr:DUF1349 domain-containing protein [Metabacillus indicus]MDX8291546.1 DUF1349 domain-containing protein [Metabacillus indicus]
MLTLNIKDGKWLNAPDEFEISNHSLSFTSMPFTDFWQRTNYGYRTDNGHAYLFSTGEKEFSFTVKGHFSGKELYDQSGIMVFMDSENWLKASVEKGKSGEWLLGSVVTNHGYSDWAISQEEKDEDTVMWYRLTRKQNDFLTEVSRDGKSFRQIRMSHLFRASNEIQFGLYACSPKESSFQTVFSCMKLEPSVWSEENHI